MRILLSIFVAGITAGILSTPNQSFKPASECNFECEWGEIGVCDDNCRCSCLKFIFG